MRRLSLLLGLYLKIRMRGLLASGASSVLVVLGTIVYFGFACLMGAAAYAVLSQARNASPERLADLAALGLNLFAVFFLTRPLVAGNLAGSSLQSLLHLPVRRSELLAYSFLTGVLMPLLLESPVLIGFALGAASSPSAILATLPLATLAHLVLLAAAHAMSFVAILISRRAWVADVARLAAFGVFLLPSLMTYRPVREVLQPILGLLLKVSPFGWAGRATVHAGAFDGGAALPWTLAAAAAFGGITVTSFVLLSRVLAGEGARRVEKKRLDRRARILLPGALGAMIETQLRSQLRTPAARMALITPALMMAFVTYSFVRRSGTGFDPSVIVAVVCLAGPSAFLTVGRGIALVLGTPASRASLLIASDVSGLLFRVTPILAVLGVTAFRLGSEAALDMAALGLILLSVSSGLQHFVAILGPFALPKDRLNPFAQRADARQGGHGLLSFAALVATALLASPFLFMLWLGARLLDGAYDGPIGGLAVFGAFATYAVLIALAARLLERRERSVLEVLLDESPA